jgi:HK97 family phage prohead protease
VNRLEEFRAGLDARQQRALEAFEARAGKFGGREFREAPIEDQEVTASGDPEAAFITRGYAAVYNRKSLDLGGFQEIIEAGAFNDVLDADPHVLLLRDHAPGTELASTRSAKFPLELRTDPRGLHFYAKAVDTTDAQDLKKRMLGGLTNQASFAFTVDSDTWEIRNEGKDSEQIIRTIHKVGELFDVTITAMGAYPQTSSQIVKDYARAFMQANGRSADEPGAEEPAPPAPTAPEAETPEVPVVERDESGDPSHPDVSERVGGDQGAVPESKQLRRARSRAQMALARHRHLIGEHDEQDRGGSAGLAGGSRADGGAVPSA